MKTIVVFLVVTLLTRSFDVCLGNTGARTFTDDRGVTHTFEGKPTFTTSAHTAVAFYHLGMDIHNQLFPPEH